MEWILLLLPVAYLCGYLFARKNESSDATKPKQGAVEYLEGLNYLLNEEQDKAIALLEQLPDEQSELFETQLALGNLFRRRGELDRAIALHQNLSTRPMLATEQRAQALAELGEDFVRTGLLDRAEALFLELIQIDRASPRTLRALMQIYEQERDWVKASKACEQLVETEPQAATVLAHYHCEIADLALNARDFSLCDRSIQDAFRAHPKSLRAHHLQAQVLLQRAETATTPVSLNAIAKSLLELVEIDPHFVEEALPLWQKFWKLEQIVDASFPQSLKLIEQFRSIEKGSSAALAKSALLEHLHGIPAALEFLNAQVELRNAPRLVSCYFEVKQKAASADDALELKRAVKAIQSALGRDLTHRCQNCGFGTTTLHWICPSCRQWDSCKPLARR